MSTAHPALRFPSALASVLAASALLALAAGCGGSGSSNSCGILSPGQSLSQEHSLFSCKGQFQLRMQGDGNLVVYVGSTPDPSNALWATGTNGADGWQAVMQNDGNFVLYDELGEPLWASNTEGHPGAYADMQDDGNLVVYLGDSKPANALWATGTNIGGGGGGGGSSGGNCTESGGSCSSSVDCCGGSVCNSDENSSFYGTCE